MLGHLLILHLLGALPFQGSILQLQLDCRCVGWQQTQLCYLCDDLTDVQQQSNLRLLNLSSNPTSFAAYWTRY